MLVSRNDILKHFASMRLNEEATTYLQFHAGRYAYLAKRIRECRKNFTDAKINILDIGPSFFTEVIRDNNPGDEVLTLGFDAGDTESGHLPDGINQAKKTFFHFDLNDAQYPERWITLPQCRIIVMAEVIEHLYTAPSLILKFVRSLLAPDGFLIIQTPNAAYWLSRLRLLAGRNPFDMIRENNKNPGHYREYTGRELLQLAREAGLEVVHFEYRNYFSHFGLKGRLNDLAQRWMPGSLRSGMTIVAALGS